MSDRIYNSVVSLLAQRSELETERPAIAQNNDASTLAEIDAELVDLRDAANLLLARRTVREETRKRATKWREIQPKCRVALDRVRELNHDFERQILKVKEARERADGRFDLLMQARDKRSKPSAYPSEAELQIQRDRETKAETAHAEALDRLRGAVTTQDNLSRELMDARLALGKLEFDERQLRPKGEAPHTPIVERGAVGELGAVPR